MQDDLERLRHRATPLDLDGDRFRKLGYQLVDQIAAFLDRLPMLPVTPGETPDHVRALFHSADPLPSSGEDPEALLASTTNLLFDHSLFNAHPRFWGYITSGAAPIGMLGDLLASAVNPNVGAWTLAPAATEIEAQSIRWIAELIGYPAACGGLLVSGGNAANFVGFLAARAAKTPWNVRQLGVHADKRPLRVYASSETHTWIQKAVDLFGLGNEAIRWIPSGKNQRLDPEPLRTQIEADTNEGDVPFLVVGTAGSVSTGAVDPLPELAALCREYDLWFHADGAYGALAAQVPGVPKDLRGLSDADSVAVDPHKWLYAPLEAGCALVRVPQRLRDAFSYHPPYYRFDQEATNYFDLGPQNSRGFRALKVWLALRQAGRDGYLRMIGDDMLLARHLFALAGQHPDLEALTQSLSITTFRYVPPDLRPNCGSEKTEKYLNELNEEILARLQSGGEAFLSNAVIQGTFALRACIVNFRTALADIEAVPPLIARLGREVDAAMRAAAEPK